MPRAVLDTNVLVAALLFGGVPRTVYDLVMTGRLLVITSSTLIDELHGVLSVKFAYPPTIADQVIAAYKDWAIVVEPSQTLSVIAQDPDDNRVLECAVSGRAEAIVSGDRHLLRLRQFRGIDILTPQAALARWAPKPR